LKKVETSTLKECGEEKARGVLHPKCKSERRKVSSFLFLHFFFSMIFLSLCVSFSFYLRRRMPRRKCLKQKSRNKRVEAGAKSERAKQKLEGKLLPFATFIFFFSMVFLFSLLLLEKKKMLGESV